MLENKLNNINITNLNSIEAIGGNVMHILKSNESSFRGYGEAYFSWVNSGFIKGWKLHKEMTLNIVVPIGCIKFVFFDKNHMNDFKIVIIGENDYSRVTVPPNIWFAFKGMSAQPSLLINIANIIHNENEVLRKEINEINFKW